MSTLAEQVRELEARCASERQRADDNFRGCQTRDKMMDEMANEIVALKASLAAARAEGAREQQEAFVAGVYWYRGLGFSKANDPRIEADTRYPASPVASEGARTECGVCKDAREVFVSGLASAARSHPCPSCRPTPSPEPERVTPDAVVIPIVSRINREVRVTAEDARRIVSLAAQDGGRDA